MGVVQLGRAGRTVFDFSLSTRPGGPEGVGGRGKQKTENTKGPPGPGGERVWAGGKQKTKNSAGPCKRPWSNEDGAATHICSRKGKSLSGISGTPGKSLADEGKFLLNLLKISDMSPLFCTVRAPTDISMYFANVLKEMFVWEGYLGGPEWEHGYRRSATWG